MRYPVAWRFVAGLLALWLSSVAFANPSLDWVRESREIDLWIFRALGYMERGEYKKASGYLEKVFNKSTIPQNTGSAAFAMAVLSERRAKYVKAAEFYRRSLNQHANYIPYQQALAAEYRLATEHFDGKRYFFGLFSYNGEAVKAYEHILSLAPFSEQAPLAMYHLAQLELRESGRIELRESSSYAKAVRRLRQFLTRYPGHELQPRVRMQLAELFLAQADRAEGDFELLQRARTFLTVLRLNPDESIAVRANDLWEKADRIEVEMLFRLGQFYQRELSYRPQVARRYLEMLLEKHPGSPLSEAARVLLSGLPKTVDAPEEVDDDEDRGDV